MAKELSYNANLVSLVEDFFKQHKCGMETFRIQTAGFNRADIQEAVKAGKLETQRGRSGGVFPYGQIPEVQNVETLKGRMADALRIIASGGILDTDVAAELISLYEAECQKRSDAKKKNTDNDD